MSFVICQRCKYQVYCTFQSSGRASECDEYEDMDVAEPLDFDFQELLRLWAKDPKQQISDVDG